MSQSRSKPNAPKPAGGWDALKISTKFASEQTGLVKGAKILLRVNQPDGFDCPGCAWPDPKDAQTFEFCENGVKAVTWEATSRRVGPEFFAAHSVAELSTWSDHELEKQGRLTHPMRYNRVTDRYEPISWNDAFKLLADTLSALASPDEAVFYTSGRASNEAAFCYQLFARVFGTNNLPDCSNMCHESSGVALTEQIGIGKGTVRLDDFEKTDCILIIGQNPGSNHPRMLTELQKASERGAKIITFNPLREPGLVSFIHPQRKLQMLTHHATPISSRYCQVAVGGDLAAIKGVCKHILEAGAIDRVFIDQHTIGFDAFEADVAATAWDEIEKQSGLMRDELKAVADDLMTSTRIIACWAMGLTQHKHAVATIQMVMNLLLLGGHIGREGAGACPVRGHSNVQGDRTMGIVERPSLAFLDALQRVFKFDPPREHGHDTVSAIDAMHSGRAKVFFALGGNFAAATPDTAHTAEAIRRCTLTAHVSTKLNRSHVTPGEDSLILPCLGRTDRDARGGHVQKVTVEDSMSQVHASYGKNDPPSNQVLSEVQIICGVARATLVPNPAIDWAGFAEDYSLIRDKIAEVLPELFHDYNDRIQTPGGFYLGNSARDRLWRTVGSRAAFVAARIPDLSLPEGQLKLMTMRSHDQFNTTIYDLNDRYRGVAGKRRVLFMHADDIAACGCDAGDAVDITSHFPDRERTVSGFELLVYDVPRGCAAGYFPELNPLVSIEAYADRSRTPMSKFIPITIRPRSEP